MLRLVRIVLTTIFTTFVTTSLAQPAIEQNHTQAWYGRVNRWTLSRDILHQELDLMQECGVSGYMIEMASWARYQKQPWDETWIKMIKREYRHLLKECRKRDIWLFVSIVNDNMGKGKYGDTGPALEEVYDYALKLAKIIKRCGSKGVIIQPVAETNTQAGKRFELECITLFDGFTLIYNGDYGSPKTCPNGYDFRAVHPSHITSNVPTDAIIISDHGVIIRELSIDGGLESKGDPNKVKMWVEKLSQQGVPVVGYYAFKYEDFDPDTILALGKKR